MGTALIELKTISANFRMQLLAIGTGLQANKKKDKKHKKHNETKKENQQTNKSHTQCKQRQEEARKAKVKFLLQLSN